MITIQKLKENIYGLGEFYHYEKVISYLIVGKENALLFDTGMGIFDIKKEIQKITKLPIIVINSHSHFDHIGGNSLFDEVWIFDNELIKNVAQNGIGNKVIKENYKDSKFFQKPDFFNLDKFKINGFKYNKLFKDGEFIDISPYNFKVIHTPGHSTDHICLYEENNGYIFLGDLMYNGPIYIENYLDYANSINKLYKLNIKEFFGGHNEFFIS